MMQVGLISNAEATSLLKSGAVGDICVHRIDATGKPKNRVSVVQFPHEASAPYILGTIAFAIMLGLFVLSNDAAIPARHRAFSLPSR
jgi:hypothetical protein